MGRAEIIDKAESGQWDDELFMAIKADPGVLDEIRKILPKDKYDALDAAYCKFVRPQDAERSRTASQAIIDAEVGSAGQPKKARRDFQAINAIDLLKMDIPPVKFCVGALIPTGLTILVAPPKMYKSYMALDMCIEIASGGTFLGRPCFKQECIYFDLESGKGRPRGRLRQVLNGRDMPDGLWIIESGEKRKSEKEEKKEITGKLFIEHLEGQLELHPDVGVIVIDVFQKIKPPGKRTQNAYESDYDIAGCLQEFAVSHDIALILIHHTNKMGKGRQTDGFDRISGSTGIMGAADCVMMIDKDDRYSDEATLYVTGRDVEQQRIRIRWNSEVFRWQYLGDAEDIEEAESAFAYENSPVIKTIRKLLSQFNGTWEGNASEIINASGYYGFQIYDDARKVGKTLSDLKFRLAAEGITFRDKRVGHSSKKVYLFENKTTASTAPTALSATTASTESA